MQHTETHPPAAVLSLNDPSGPARERKKRKTERGQEHTASEKLGRDNHIHNFPSITLAQLLNQIFFFSNNKLSERLVSCSHPILTFVNKLHNIAHGLLIKTDEMILYEIVILFTISIHYFIV